MSFVSQYKSITTRLKHDSLRYRRIRGDTCSSPAASRLPRPRRGHAHGRGVVCAGRVRPVCVSAPPRRASGGGVRRVRHAASPGRSSASLQACIQRTSPSKRHPCSCMPATVPRGEGVGVEVGVGTQVLGFLVQIEAACPRGHARTSPAFKCGREAAVRVQTCAGVCIGAGVWGGESLAGGVGAPEPMTHRDRPAAAAQEPHICCR